MPYRENVSNSKRRQYISFPFEFKGNEDDCQVKLCPPSRGDGEISTGHGGKKYAYLKGQVWKYSNKILRFRFTYMVWEPEWNTKDKRDALYFTKYLDYDMREYTDEYTNSLGDGKSKRHLKRVWNLAQDYQEAYYQDYYNSSDERHGYMKVAPESYPQENRTQSWLPIKDLRFKIDDSGNELRGKGNIGVRGRVSLYVDVQTSITDQIWEDEPVETEVGSNRRPGSERVVDNIPNAIHGYLGCGYDITGNYITNSYRGRVLNLDLMNQERHLRMVKTEEFHNDSFTGENVRELCRKMENSLNIKMSVGVAGFGFSTEIKENYSMSHREEEVYRYAIYKNVYEKASYKLDGTGNPRTMFGYLDEGFLDKLDSMTADELVRDYGTHVVLGCSFGARLMYHMRYRSSKVADSEAKSFSTSTSFSFNRKGESKLDKKEEAKKSAPANVFELLNAGKVKSDDLDDLAEVLKLSGMNKGGQPSSQSSGGSGGTGFKIGVESSWSSQVDSKFEEEHTEANTYAKGGKANLCMSAGTNTADYNEWKKSIDESNCVCSDLLPGTVLPLYMFVPAGHRLTAQDVKMAADRYIAGGGVKEKVLKEDVQPYPVRLKDGDKCWNFSKESGGNSDSEVCTQRNKKTGWKFKMELVNLPDGHFGVAVWLNVAESGFRASRTHLQLRDVIDVSVGLNKRASIKPGIRMTWESREIEVIGQHHEWMDMTHAVLNCPYIKTDPTHRFLVRVDGKGGDYNNVGFDCTFLVPYVYYSEDY